MADSGKGKILVVDDDRLVLATLSHGLAQAGYEVVDADNGDDAILLAREHRPDLALLDIRMEGLSGFDVAAYLREHLHLPFMFLSAFSDEKTAEQVTALGAVAYLVKPLDISQILPTVATAMAQLRRQAGGAVAEAGASPMSGSTPAAPAASPQFGAAAPSLAGSPTSLDLVSMAVGVLMHRYSLPRQSAWQRLQRLAHEDGQGEAEQARQLLAAVELLARGHD